MSDKEQIAVIGAGAFGTALAAVIALTGRADVVSAERAAAAANAKIGVAEAAFFLTLNLTGQVGYRGTALGGLFSVPNRVWTLGHAGEPARGS